MLFLSGRTPAVFVNGCPPAGFIPPPLLVNNAPGSILPPLLLFYALEGLDSYKEGLDSYKAGTLGVLPWVGSLRVPSYPHD